MLQGGDCRYIAKADEEMLFSRHVSRNVAFEILGVLDFKLCFDGIFH